MPGPWHPNTGRPGCGLVRNSWSAEEGFSSFTLLLSDPLEKGMATHSSILVWEIPWTEEPGRLQSMGSQRVRHDLATKQQHVLIHLLMDTGYFHIFAIVINAAMNFGGAYIF